MLIDDGLGLREVVDDNPETVEEAAAVIKIMGNLNYYFKFRSACTKG